jgi:phage/plasmid-like protein (TIGR03299 family)
MAGTRFIQIGKPSTTAKSRSFNRAAFGVLYYLLNLSLNTIMAHQFDSGLFIGEAAWHGLGLVIDTAPSTTAEAMRLAGMDWTVLQKPVYRDVHGSSLPPEKDGYRLVEVDPDWKRIVRSDNNFQLQVCKKDWTPVQNSQAFEWFDPLIADGDVELSACVSLKEGKRVAITAKVKDAIGDVVKGDPIEGFLLLFNGHDGTLGVGVRFTNTRVVCHNTLQMNLNAFNRAVTAKWGENHGNVYWKGKNASIKHTPNVGVGLIAVREALDIHKRAFRQTIEEYRAMTQVQLKAGDFEKYLTDTLRSHAKFEIVNDLQCHKKLVANFESGAGMDIPGVRGTAWAAYNAVTDWTSHQRGKSSGDQLENFRNRLDANWFGSGAAIDRSAYDVALALTKS